MSEDARNAGAVEVSDGPEYRVLASLFGVLLACAGLLVGTMMRERSLDYWLEDIVPLLILMVSGRSLLKSSIELARESMAYTEQLKTVEAFRAKQHEMMDVEPMELPKLAAKPKTGFSEEEVLEAVAKRIEEQKAKAMQGNKFAN